MSLPIAWCGERDSAAVGADARVLKEPWHLNVAPLDGALGGF